MVKLPWTYKREHLANVKRTARWIAWLSACTVCTYMLQSALEDKGGRNAQ